MMVYTQSIYKQKKKGPKAKSIEYDLWLAKYKDVKPKQISRKVYVPPKPLVRTTAAIPSMDSGIGNATKPIEGKRYTGNKIIGIATMHKSNAVPVFDAEDCVAISNMRR